MPHLIAEYSRNLEEVVDMAAFVEALRRAAVEIEAFPTPGIRVRAIAVDHYAIADGDPKHGFVDVSVRLRAGRPDDVKQDAIARLFEAAKAALAPAMATRSIALSMEMRDIDPDLSPKTGTVREHMSK